VLHSCRHQLSLLCRRHFLEYEMQIIATDKDGHETLKPETETLSFFVETRPKRDVGESRDRLKTETSRPRPHPLLPMFLSEIIVV